MSGEPCVHGADTGRPEPCLEHAVGQRHLATGDIDAVPLAHASEGQVAHRGERRQVQLVLKVDLRASGAC
jgi:hypothetical protein